MTSVVCVILVVCLTSVERRDSGRMPNSGRISRLQLHFPTPVDVMTPVTHHSCERLPMGGLADCSILQSRHLVGSRLGGTHDSISIPNLSISWLRMLK
jgi:hypothetical protein